jgi:uncharacterized membrane protein (UPF0127 family)
VRRVATKSLGGASTIFGIATAVVLVVAVSWAYFWTDTGVSLIAEVPDTAILITATGRHTFTVEIADTPEERSSGLMHRREMADDQGMLFDFGNEQELGFWMSNTYLSLDMIFVRADGTILSIAADTKPLSEKRVPSNGNARFVLEVVAGTARRLELKPGDRLEHRLIGG